LPFRVWYQNIHSALFGIATKHACDGQTGRIITLKLASIDARAVKTKTCNIHGNNIH